MNKGLRDTRDLLWTLLSQMGDEPPRPIDVGELAEANRWYCLITTCSEIIAHSISAIATSPDDRRIGFETLMECMRARILEEYDDHQRPH